ncbi:MAG: protein kinase [Puniceicoccales bacterium]|jgi:serine/threonine protein kinase|nr:protein kinase [Puniceicoccales bacterium]
MPPIPKTGTLIVPENSGNYYSLLRHIHKGRMSNAYEATDSGGVRVFLKSYTTPAPGVSWYKPYIAHVRELNRRVSASEAAPYCLKSNTAFEARIGNCPYPSFFQAYEFIEGGYDLETLLRNATEGSAALAWQRRVLMAKVILAGIKKLHAAGVVHCDLKPANIQMPPVSAGIGFRPLIVDTDFSILADKRAPWHAKQGYIGTPNYHSPEHLRGGDSVPSAASDVFTAALILYELLGQGNPCARPTQEEYEKTVLTGDAPPIAFQGDFTAPEIVPQITQLLLAALSPDPIGRPSAETLHKAFLAAAVAGDSSGATSATQTQNVAEKQLSLEPVEHPSGSEPPRLVFSQDVKVGKQLLTQLSADARFSSEPQFCLSREEATARWLVSHAPSAKNLSLLNGKVFAENSPLADGDILSLAGRASGREALKILVRIP